MWDNKSEKYNSNFSKFCRIVTGAIFFNPTPPERIRKVIQEADKLHKESVLHQQETRLLIKSVDESLQLSEENIKNSSAERHGL